MKFEWTPELEIDGGDIDSDHQALFVIANRMFSLTLPNREVEEIKQVIQELYEYVRYHFAREEALMTKLGYPEKKAHMEKHAAIISDMNSHLTSAHHMGEILGNFKSLTHHWIMDHIMEEDLKIHRFIQENKRQSQ